MADVLFVLLIVTVFSLAALFVRACDHIIGPEEAAAPALDEAARDEVAA